MTLLVRCENCENLRAAFLPAMLICLFLLPREAQPLLLLLLKPCSRHRVLRRSRSGCISVSQAAQLFGSTNHDEARAVEHSGTALPLPLWRRVSGLPLLTARALDQRTS
jgi:hypothetical protein